MICACGNFMVHVKYFSGKRSWISARYCTRCGELAAIDYDRGGRREIWKGRRRSA